MHLAFNVIPLNVWPNEALAKAVFLLSLCRYESSNPAQHASFFLWTLSTTTDVSVLVTDYLIRAGCWIVDLQPLTQLWDLRCLLFKHKLMWTTTWAVWVHNQGHEWAPFTDAGKQIHHSGSQSAEEILLKLYPLCNVLNSFTVVCLKWKDSGFDAF